MSKPSILAAALWQLRKKLYNHSQPLTVSDKQALTESFIAVIMAHLPGDGWKYADSQFTNVEGAAERIFFASITDEELELWIKIGMGARFPEVEKIWRQSQGIKESLDPWTVEGVIVDYVPRAHLRYRMDHPRDLEFIKPKIVGVIDKACVPFWNQFATISDLDRNWNQKPFAFEHDGTNVLHHATRSVIAAHLAKNMDFENLVKVRRSEVTSQLNPALLTDGLQQFEKLITWLRNTR